MPAVFPMARPLVATDRASCLAVYGDTPPEDLQAYARGAATRQCLAVEPFVRQIDQESGFQACVGSPAGAQGVAQIMPEYHPDVNPWEPYESLDWAAKTMDEYVDGYGTWRLALAAYNAGSGAVARYDGVPPFEETERYLTAILGSGWPEPPAGAPCGIPSPTPEAAPVLPGLLMVLGLAVGGAMLVRESLGRAG